VQFSSLLCVPIDGFFIWILLSFHAILIDIETAFSLVFFDWLFFGEMTNKGWWTYGHGMVGVGVHHGDCWFQPTGSIYD
jgi:hypothetical protein